MNNVIERMLTAGYDEERAIIERFIPETIEDAEAQAEELARLEYTYEAMMWHLEASGVVESILKTAKEL